MFQFNSTALLKPHNKTQHVLTMAFITEIQDGMDLKNENAWALERAVPDVNSSPCTHPAA